MGQYADAVPFGSAISIVTSHIQEARELQRLAEEKQEKMMVSIKRTEKTLLQMEDNQLTDQSKHKPVANLLTEYAGLLGRTDEVCKKWSRLNCMTQLWRSSRYNDEFDELIELMATLKGDLTLSTLAKMDAEASINAKKTQQAISDSDEKAEGRHQETTIQLEQATAVQEATRQQVLELKELVENSVTTNAMTCEMTNQWDTILEFDWTATSVGVVTDACRAIAVGLVDQDNAPQMLLMQFFDTEEEYDYRTAQRRSGSIITGQRPTWAMTMKAQEMKAVRASFLKQAPEAQQPVMIHEEPLLDDQDWYARAWWVPSEKDGCLGLRLEVKASQKDSPTVHFILFALQGDLFRKVGKPKDLTVQEDTSQSLLDSYLLAKKSNPLPLPSSQGLESPLYFPAEKKALQLDYAAQGDKEAWPMEIEIDPKGGTAYQNQSSKYPANLHQQLVSGKIILRNPTDQDMNIRSITTQVKEEGKSEFVDCIMTEGDYVRQSTYIGMYKGSYMIWGIPHPDAEWIEEGTELKIPAGESIQIVVKAIWVLENRQRYNGRPLDMRLHASVADLVTVKATFHQADTDTTQSICWDFTNEVMEDRSFTNYQELLNMKSESNPNIPLWKERRLQEIGDDYMCHLWMHVDDPETLKRYYIVVSSKKEAPRQWVIRASSTSDKFPGNHHNVYLSDLERLVFEAQREAKKEKQTTGLFVVDKSGDWGYDKTHCKIRVLVDLERGVAFGIEAEITLNDGAMVAKDSMYLDYDRFLSKSYLSKP